MDEAEKYKQRLEAIAEKRRLQEEQDRMRREMEDEKLRQQQLKRKSLRDQWLMEGAPLSPASSDPRSPLLLTQARHLETHTVTMPSERELLGEHREQTEVVTEAGRKVAVTNAGEEMALEVVQNGEDTEVSGGACGEEKKVNPSVATEEITGHLTNGGDTHYDISHSAAELKGQPMTNGFIAAPGGPVSMQLGHVRIVGDEDSSQAAVINIVDEEEETVLIRAECVIITDEGDDISETQTLGVLEKESVQVEDELEAEAAEVVIKTQLDPGMLSELDKSLETELVTGAQPATEVGDTWGSEIGDRETNSDVHEEPAPEHLQAAADALEGAAGALVPIYSEAPSSSFSPKVEAKKEASEEAENFEAGLNVDDASFVRGQFQEVSLADHELNHRTEAGPVEQEPLLSEVKVPSTNTEPAGAPISAGKETQSRESGPEAPKRKVCQCCSVM